MISQRVVDSVRVSEVKGHADDDVVAVGRVRAVDKIGNDSADIAADLGRRRVSDLVMNIRGRVVSACAFWFPVVLDSHRFSCFYCSCCCQ